MKPFSVVLPLLVVSSTAALLESIAAQVLGPVRQVLGLVGKFVEGPWKPTALQIYLSSIEDSCSKLQKGTLDPVTWTVSTDTFCPNHFRTAPYVANGYFGQTLPSESVGYWIEKRADGSWASNGELIPNSEILC